MFIIEARTWWLKGYIVGNTVYEHKTLPFQGNHNYICQGNPGELEIGLPVLRRRHQSLVQDGVHQNPLAVGVYTLYLCEGPRIYKAFLAPSNSLVDPGSDFNKLDAFSQGLPLPELAKKTRIPELDSFLLPAWIVVLSSLHSRYSLQSEKVDARHTKDIFTPTPSRIQNITNTQHKAHTRTTFQIWRLSPPTRAHLLLLVAACCPAAPLPGCRLLLLLKVASCCSSKLPPAAPPGGRRQPAPPDRQKPAPPDHQKPAPPSGGRQQPAPPPDRLQPAASPPDICISFSSGHGHP